MGEVMNTAWYARRGFQVHTIDVKWVLKVWSTERRDWAIPSKLHKFLDRCQINNITQDSGESAFPGKKTIIVWPSFENQQTSNKGLHNNRAGRVHVLLQRGGERFNDSGLLPRVNAIKREWEQKTSERLRRRWCQNTRDTVIKRITFCVYMWETKQHRDTHKAVWHFALWYIAVHTRRAGHKSTLWPGCVWIRRLEGTILYIWGGHCGSQRRQGLVWVGYCLRDPAGNWLGTRLRGGWHSTRGPGGGGGQVGEGLVPASGFESQCIDRFTASFHLPYL